MATSLEVVLPVLNEERVLAASVNAVHGYFSSRLKDYDWRIAIADNGSTDLTPRIAERLCEIFERLTLVRLDQRGRGRAIGKTWLESEADILGYMDVDLSTNLSDLVPLVQAIDKEGYDLAIGSRLKDGAQVERRNWKREIISRSYNKIVRAMFGIGFQDAQCGFKLVSSRAARDLVPLVKDTGWFFDSELLILAEKNGYRIKEVPVRWTDDPDSRVKVVSTAVHDMMGLLRLRMGGLQSASEALNHARPPADSG